MLALRLSLLALVVAALAACGSSGGGGRGGSGLTADVSKAKAELTSGNVAASARVRVGGVAGKHVVLEWGLVDAEQGRESQAERVVARYVTTSKVVEHDETIHFQLPQTNSPYLVHFVLYAPDGTYLDSQDTGDFGGNG